MKGFTPIPCYSRYLASRDGRLFSTCSNRLLHPSRHTGGYETVMLMNDSGVLKRVFVHRLVMRTFVGIPPDKYEVDHINRVKTDNRLINLRYVPHATNQHNHRKHLPPTTMPRSRYKGVHAIRARGSFVWRVGMGHKGKMIVVGKFSTEREAATAYDRESVKKYGACAVTNKSLGLL